MQSTLPIDIRLMNITSAALFTLAAVVLMWWTVAWVTRLPAFTIRAIRVEGDVARNTADTIRAHAAPRLAGNLFTLDLMRAQRAFESVPWVRRAVVRRDWPNRLTARLEEHRAVAYWGDGKLVNSFGEVFEANLGDVEDDQLPSFEGPDGSAALMLELHGRLNRALAPLLGAQVETLALSVRGSWHAALDNGAEIEIGRGSLPEVMERVERLGATLAQVTARYAGPLEYADLRHRDGYALRLKGVATTPRPNAGPAGRRRGD